MANDITGSCDIVDSVELVPDDVDDIVPPGYDQDFNTNDTSDIVTGGCDDEDKGDE